MEFELFEFQKACYSFENFKNFPKRFSHPFYLSTALIPLLYLHYLRTCSELKSNICTDVYRSSANKGN